jgi:DNA polymerase III epsilon subunit-like protein
VVLLNAEDGRIVEQFSSLVHPERSIPPWITKITGSVTPWWRKHPSFAKSPVK